MREGNFRIRCGCLSGCASWPGVLAKMWAGEFFCRLSSAVMSTLSALPESVNRQSVPPCPVCVESHCLPIWYMSKKLRPDRQRVGFCNFASCSAFVMFSSGPVPVVVSYFVLSVFTVSGFVLSTHSSSCPISNYPLNHSNSISYNQPVISTCALERLLKMIDCLLFIFQASDSITDSYRPVLYYPLFNINQSKIIIALTDISFFACYHICKFLFYFGFVFHNYEI